MDVPAEVSKVLQTPMRVHVCGRGQGRSVLALRLDVCLGRRSTSPRRRVLYINILRATVNVSLNFSSALPYLKQNIAENRAMLSASKFRK